MASSSPSPSPSPSSSSMPPSVVKVEGPQNWSELPSELIYSIMLRLGAVEILGNVQEVCTSWRRVSMEPSMWRKIKIDMRNSDLSDDVLIQMCCNAINRSDGGLVEISIEFGTDHLLAYIADRSSNLRSLGLNLSYYPMTNDGLVNAVQKLPLLEVLEVTETYYENLDLKAIGHSCPKLNTLKLNCSGYGGSWYKRDDDDDALAIAENMHELRHLQLLANRLTDTGLNAILDNCPHLEHLDLRQCLNIKLSRDLEKKCLVKVKDFRRHNDSTTDCPFDVAFVDSYSDDGSDDMYMADEFVLAYDEDYYYTCSGLR